MPKPDTRCLPVGIGDIESMLLMVQSYRAYLRATDPARHRRRLQQIDTLHLRLQGFLLRVRHGERPLILPLMAEEWHALYAALQGWVTILRQVFPPSTERELVIEATLALARDVEPMLSA